MAVDLIALGYKIDTAPIKSANSELDKLGKHTKTASKEVSNLSKETESSSKSIGALTGSLKTLIGAYAGLASVSKLANISDEYTKYTAQLKLATKSQAEYNIALKDTSRIANTAQASLGSISTLYARLSSSLGSLNASQKQVATITEVVGLGLKINGANASETASAMMQLSQAFSSGVLRGDEFNSMSENALPLMQALAKSMEVPIEQLREMATQGQITSEQLLKAFGDEKLLEVFRTQAKEVNTLSGAFQTLKNEGGSAIGELTKETGLLDLMTGSINALRDAIVGLKNVAKGVTPIQSAGIIASLPAPLQVAIGLAKTYGLVKKGSKAVQAISSANNGNSIGGAGAITGGNAPYPNFSATVEAENIDEIHRKQEEAARKQLDAQKVFNDARKKADKEREEYSKQEREDWLKEETQRYKTQVENEREIYENKLRNIDLLQKQSEERFREEHRLQEELLREQKRANDEFSKSLTDALFRGFEDGKDFIKNFKDTLLNAFQTMILRPRIEAIISGTGIGGMLSGNAMAGEGAGGMFGGLGGGDIFGTIKNIFSGGNSAIVGGIESIAASLTDGLGGIGDSIGGFVGANASAIANFASFGGAALSLLKGDIKGAAFQGAGAGIGLALGGPIGGAIGSFLGGAVGGLFGGSKLPPRVTASRSGSYSSNQFTAFEGADVGKRNLNANSSLDALNETFSRNIGSLLSAFGVNQSINTNSLLTKKKNVRARFNANIGGIQTTGYEESFGKKGDFNAALQSLVNNALGTVTVQAIQASALPQEIKNLFDNLTDKTEVVNMINASMSLQASQKVLADKFNLTATQAAHVAKSTGSAGQGLADYINKIIAVANSSRTVGEVLALAQKNFRDATGWKAVPENLKAFDAILKSINKGTQLGVGQFSVKR
jgi:tape measure domain-containing protein